VYGKAVDDHGALTVKVVKIEVLGKKQRGITGKRFIKHRN
jgi:hypothetical protein